MHQGSLPCVCQLTWGTTFGLLEFDLLPAVLSGMLGGSSGQPTPFTTSGNRFWEFATHKLLLDLKWDKNK